MQTTTNTLVPPRAATAGLFSFVLIGAAQALYGPALPGFKETFALSGGAAGVIISIHNAGALLGVLSALPLAGCRVARWRAGGAVILLSIGALIVATTPTWSLALVGAFIIGTAYGALTIGINGLYAVGFGAHSPAMVNLLNAVFGIGAILGPLLIALNAADVRFPFLVLTAMAALLAPFALTLDDRVPATSRSHERKPNTRLLIAFTLLLALGVGVEASTIGYAATYLVALGETTFAAAAVTSLFFLLFTVSRLAAIGLSLRFTPPQLVMGGMSLAIIFFSLSHHAPLAPITITLLGAALAVFFPNGINWFSSVFGASGGTVVIIAGALVGGIFVPALVAWTVALFGESYIVTTLLVLNLFALLIGGRIAMSLRTA